MYGKLVDGILENPPDNISNNIQAMKDDGYKPVKCDIPYYDVNTQYLYVDGYNDSINFIETIYKVVDIEQPEEQQYEEQTSKLFKLINIDIKEKLASLTDEQALQVPLLYQSWISGYEYKINDRVLYQGILYKVLQTHKSQDTWEPDIAPSLFAKVLTSNQSSDNIKEWEQPDSTNPYMKGDKVKYDGKIYKSIIDNNIWSPEAYPQGWEEL